MSTGFFDGLIIGFIIVAAVAFASAHLGVSRRRAEQPGGESGRRTAPSAMAGLLLEAVAYAILFVWPGRGRIEGVAWHIVGALCAAAGVIFTGAALRHLRDNWRIQAVVTDSHTLVTTGPYRIVRHPIYLAVFLFLIAVGLAYSDWIPLAVAIPVCIIGTELRVRAEDGLLLRRFGPDFDDYRRRVKAYIPFVR